MITQRDLAVSTLGERRHQSPLPMSTVAGDGLCDFVPDDMRVLHDIRIRAGQQLSDLAFELAGPRQQLFFEPAKTRAAIVTCGGLCPGLNNIIRTLFFELTANYCIAEVLGIHFGYAGLCPDAMKPPTPLTSKMVEGINHEGGTILGSSRGPQDPSTTVDFLLDRKINILFCLGGDGTQRGAHAIADEVARRKVPIVVVGIPKTIDNDIQYCEPTFGFATAVEEADRVIDRAHIEANGCLNGVAVVKLMGREAGFIAAAATVASGHVNFTMIPEVPVKLEGPGGFLEKLERRLAARQHAVVVVAEGAGQDLLPASDRRDASGNRVLGDIGKFLKEKITDHFTARKLPIGVRYFDPSYFIRSCAANSTDDLLCEHFARNAVHAAMAGKTDVLIGRWHATFIHVPLTLCAGQKKKRLSPECEWWATVLAITGQDKW